MAAAGALVPAAVVTSTVTVPRASSAGASTFNWDALT
jgi:hypothetical protein